MNTNTTSAISTSQRTSKSASVNDSQSRRTSLETCPKKGTNTWTMRMKAKMMRKRQQQLAQGQKFVKVTYDEMLQALWKETHKSWSGTCI